MKKRIETYLQHIEGICGDSGQFFKISEADEPRLVAVVAYSDVPEEGCITAFSYGLSTTEHPEWVAGRPELVISVDSKDMAWAVALGEVVRNGRDRCLFSYGDIVNFGEKISDESDMTHFLVFACTVLDAADISVELSDGVVNLSQLYPIHASEVELIKKIGAERFVMSLDTDLFNVRRGAAGASGLA
jgi:hypothetical protein